MKNQKILELLNKLTIVDFDCGSDGDESILLFMLVENDESLQELIDLTGKDKLEDLMKFTKENYKSETYGYEEDDAIVEISMLLSNVDINWYYENEKGFFEV